MKSTEPISYRYDVDGHEVVVTREHTGTAYARNGNVANPTEYFWWAVAVDGVHHLGGLDRRATAYEYGRAKVLGIRYSSGVGPNMRGSVNVRNWTVVQDEMKANYRGRVVAESE